MKAITRTIRSASDLKLLYALLDGRSAYPYTVSITDGEPKRTERQNRLMWAWFKDAESQGDMTATEQRAYCKLHFGIPILRAENDDFRMQYDEIIRPLPYEEKIVLMLPPIELPVTSLMTVKQKTKMLEAIQLHYTGLGYLLTEPAMMGLEDWRK